MNVKIEEFKANIISLINDNKLVAYQVQQIETIEGTPMQRVILDFKTEVVE